MLVKQAKDIARQWVAEEASKLPGFFGAYIAGSTNWMSDDAAFPATSDVDVKVVIQGPEVPSGFQKILYCDIMLEISYAPSDQFLSPEPILGNYFVAGHFTTPCILADPFGRLTQIQAVVARDFAKRHWVYQRCTHARDWCLTSLQWLDESAPLHDQFFSSIYAASMPSHIVLVADLKNPTVRRMLVAAREVLTRNGCSSLYEAMLDILGSAQLGQDQVRLMLMRCTEAFDVAKNIVKTPFFGSSSISDDARPIMIDGTSELIEQGDYREAAFWIAVTHTWCQTVLFNDGSAELKQRFTPSYYQLLSELGVTGYSDLLQRTQRIRDLLPHVWEAVDTIIAANPEIVD